MKNAKTLLVTSQFPPPMMGGSLIYYFYMLKLCRDKDYYILGPKSDENIEKKFDEVNDFTIFRLKSLNKYISKTAKIFRFWIISYKIFYICLKYKIDVIHIGDGIPELPAIFAKKILNKKLIRTFHGEDLAALLNIEKTKNIRVRIVRKQRLHCLKYLDGIQTNSQNTLALYHRLKIPGSVKVLVMQPGIDENKTHMPEVPIPEVVDVIHNKIILLTIGRLEPHKGHDMVMAVMKSLLPKYPNLLYVIAAGYAKPHQIQKLNARILDLELNNHVLFFPDLPTENVIWLYQNSDVFIMPNREMHNNVTEGYGIVFLEAGYFGLPVIGGNAGGVPEAILENETGFLVDGASLEDIFEKTKNLLESPDLRLKLGRNGKEHARRCTWDVKSESYQTFLDTLVNEPH